MPLARFVKRGLLPNRLMMIHPKKLRENEPNKAPIEAVALNGPGA